MDKNGFITIVFLFVFVSTTCNSSPVLHLRQLIANEGNNASAASQVPPIANPVNVSSTNTSSIDTEKPQLDKSNQTKANETIPIDPKGSNKPDNKTITVDAPNPPVDVKNGSVVDGDNGKAKEIAPTLDYDADCDGSISVCSEQGMTACIITSSDGGSSDMFLVTKNEGESTLKVNVKLPNSLKDILPDFDLPKHTSKRINISSSSVTEGNKLIVTSGTNPPCELTLGQSVPVSVPVPVAVQSVSVDKIIQQLSLYSKQVNPIYAVYASFLVTLLFGATWACCRLRKKNQQDVQYQELEMGSPESAPAAVDVSEGWDHDWDNDWDEEIAVKSPSGHQVRSVSADGLTSRSPNRDGWDNDWED